MYLPVLRKAINTAYFYFYSINIYVNVYYVKEEISYIVPKKSKITFKYTQRQSDGLLTEKILYALSDNKSKYLFNSIAIISGVGEQSIDGQTLMSPLNLTANQYYKRIRCLRNLGLISKKKSKFTLTLFGRIVYEAQKKIDVAVQNRWKLAALDTIEKSMPLEGMPIEERDRLITAILGDREIKQILLYSSSHDKVNRRR